uniref:Kelch-like protein n=1 Tax=Gouania willdenowi TaxID=441366 RepID=A0A8C5DDS0_GOUWI
MLLYCGWWFKLDRPLVLNTAEYYNPDTNQWTLITPMGTPRYDLGVVAYMGHIFAVGGRDGSRYQRSAEAYDPVTNTWYDVPEMVHRHSYFDIAVMNKQIFVVSLASTYLFYLLRQNNAIM